MNKLIVTLCMLFTIVMVGSTHSYGSDHYILSNGKAVPACYITNYMGHTDLNYKSFTN